MISLVFLACACGLLGGVAAGKEEGGPILPFYPYLVPNPDDFKELFDQWIAKYGRSYSSDDEYKQRLIIFMENALYIDQVNREQKSYELEINKFADMKSDEFRSSYLLNAPQDCSATSGNHRPSGAKLPTAVDWRDKGVVTPVKNQGECGSCWTFSTTGCLESHHAIKTSDLISLSEQQLVDCAGAFNNHGCDGGLPSQAFEYIRYNGGIETEENYPYRAHDETCQFDKSKVAATVSGQVNITKGDEDMIVDAVANNGPVSICYDVANDFRFYKKGVYQSKECKDDSQHVNHAVLAVGYNQTETGELYWIVKNSWGTSWGLDGYFWILRGANECGLAECASYPLV